MMVVIPSQSCQQQRDVAGAGQVSFAVNCKFSQFCPLSETSVAPVLIPGACDTEEKQPLIDIETRGNAFGCRLRGRSSGSAPLAAASSTASVAEAIRLPAALPPQVRATRTCIYRL